jgi:hypothetical protein
MALLNIFLHFGMDKLNQRGIFKKNMFFFYFSPPFSLKSWRSRFSKSVCKLGTLYAFRSEMWGRMLTLVLQQPNSSYRQIQLTRHQAVFDAN